MIRDSMTHPKRHRNNDPRQAGMDRLPGPLQITRYLVHQFRRELKRRGLASWQIFCTNALGFFADQIVDQPDKFGEAGLSWQPLGDSKPILRIGRVSHEARADEHFTRSTGFLHLRQAEVAIGRWMIYDKKEHRWELVELSAAPAIDRITQLTRRVERNDRDGNRGLWHVYNGALEKMVEKRADLSWDQLVLPGPVLDRLRGDVCGFFTPAVRQHYARLQVPYRRGILLYGPPGNGKTSIIRVLASSLSHVNGILVRPHARFDDDDMSRLVERWRQLAPAILVIEDLDTVVGLCGARISTFLNLIDGVIQSGGEGLMLIATTNHPENLDPAINNRPGRFDVVLEIPLPVREQRRLYLEKAFAEMDEEQMQTIVRATEGLSFAHLREIVNLSGIYAIRHGRPDRTASDVVDATLAVVQSHDAAERGFPQQREGGFGFSASP